MAPGWPAPSASTSADLGLDHRPRRRGTAPGRGCPARRGPGRAGAPASSSGMRQSTPTTSAPAAAMQPSSSPVSTPKWMRGTPRSATASKIRVVCGSTKRSVVGRAEVADPAVEQLHRAGARPRPGCAATATARSASRSISACHSGGVAVHQRLGAGVGARRPALDEVAGDGERRAGEPDERHVELVHQDADRLEHVRRVDARARAGGCGRGRRSTRNGLLDDRTDARGDVDAEADGGDRHHDVAVEDGGVDAVAAHRLQRDLGGQVGLGDGVEDGALAPERPVLGQRPAGLAHEPHRHAIGGRAGSAGEAATGAQEGGVVGGGAGGRPAESETRCPR